MTFADSRLSALVSALNRLPGVNVFAYCIGPDDVDHAAADAEYLAAESGDAVPSRAPGLADVDPGPGQVDPGEFLVAFDVDASAGGWRSLQLVAWAASQGRDRDRIDVVAIVTGDGPESLAFQLEGMDWASPERLAERIEATVGCQNGAQTTGCKSHRKQKGKQR